MESITDTNTTGTRVKCKHDTCNKRTTKIYCFKHRPENANYSTLKYQ